MNITFEMPSSKGIYTLLTDWNLINGFSDISLEFLTIVRLSVLLKFVIGMNVVFN